MSDKIYNKNAREKALLEEAYTSVYNEGVNYSDTSGGAARRAAANRKQLHKAGAVRLQSPEGTSRATLPKGDPKIKELKKQGYTEIPIEDAEDTDVADQAEFAKIDPLEDEKARLQGFNPRENEEGELSDDWEKPNYRGDQHDFQPGEIVEVGPWGPDDEADHLEVVLQIKGDVVNTIPITDDAYGVQYGGRGGADIELIRPQSESSFDDSDFKPADGREY